MDYPLTAVPQDEALDYLLQAITRKDVLPDPTRFCLAAPPVPVVLAERAVAFPEGLFELPHMIALVEVAGIPTRPTP